MLFHGILYKTNITGITKENILKAILFITYTLNSKQVCTFSFKAMLLHMITDKFEPLNKIDAASKLLSI